MDVHPSKDLLCVAVKGGRVVQYETKRKVQTVEILIDLPITEVPVLREDREDLESRGSRMSRYSPMLDAPYVVVKHEVNLLKFSPKGEHLVLATENGSIYGLDPIILTPFSVDPFKFTSEPITKMAFSDDGRFMSMADKTGKIFLLYHCNRRWLLIGKNRCHTKTVTELVFVKNLGMEYPRLFSIGEDRMLVEFDIEISVGNGRLDAANVFWYDQTPAKAVKLLPQEILSLFGVSTVVYESVLLISDDQLKVKLVDYNSGMVLGTFLGPLFGGRMYNINVSVLLAGDVTV